jgi:riboflavin kinase/FMN adenylyltransferase
MQIMRVFYQIEDFPKNQAPIALTIGTFDGLHKGHMHLLKHLSDISGSHNQTGVITFSNHPSQVLRPHSPHSFVCTLDHKIKMLSQAGVEYLFLIPFTRDLAEQTASSFISKLQEFIPFSHLILGHDARIGKNREGDKNAIRELAKEGDFEVQYLDALHYDESPISSTSIKEAIQKGNLSLAESLLGRPYSIYSKVIHGSGQGKHIGFPTANVKVTGLCLPPQGVYAATLIDEGKEFLGIANLGTAPTLKKSAEPLLEMHVFDHNYNLYEKYVEIILHEFLRPECTFKSSDALKIQIQKDIVKARLFFSSTYLSMH